MCKIFLVKAQSKVGQIENRGHQKGEKIIISKVVNNGFQNKELVESFLTVFVSSKTEPVRGSYAILKFKVRDEYS